MSSSKHYESFIAVVRRGTVSAAATDLGLPRGTVSRHIARLESDLGVALLHRTTRRVTTTPAGQRLYERVAPLLQEMADAESEARQAAQALSGVVRVSVLPLVAAALAPALAHVHAEHPGLSVEVVANVRLVDLRSEGYDLAIWAGEPRDPELVTRKLAVGRVGLVASPNYVTAHGLPASIEELANHTLIRGHSGSDRPRVWWPQLDGGRFRVDGTLVTNDAPLLRAMVLEGRGVALLSDLNAGKALTDGRLLRVLPDEVGTTAVVRLLAPRRTLLPRRTRVVMDAIIERFEAPREQPPGPR